MERVKTDARTFCYPRTLLPYLAKVLERADYYGESIDYDVKVREGLAIVIYEKKMVRNFTYNLYRKAKAKQKKDVIFEK